MNVPHPNSIKNSTLLAVYRAGDSVYNLHTALDQFKEQFEEMDGMKWRCEKNNAYVIADFLAIQFLETTRLHSRRL